MSELDKNNKNCKTYLNVNKKQKISGVNNNLQLDGNDEVLEKLV